MTARALHLWAKVKRGLLRHLSPEKDAYSILTFLSIPPAQVLEKAVDAFAARCHTLARAEARKRMDDTQEALQVDVGYKAKACWKRSGNQYPHRMWLFRILVPLTVFLLILRSSMGTFGACLFYGGLPRSHGRNSLRGIKLKSMTLPLSPPLLYFWVYYSVFFV